MIEAAAATLSTNATAMTVAPVGGPQPAAPSADVAASLATPSQPGQAANPTAPTAADMEVRPVGDVLTEMPKIRADWQRRAAVMRERVGEIKADMSAVADRLRADPTDAAAKVDMERLKVELDEMRSDRMEMMVDVQHRMQQASFGVTLVGKVVEQTTGGVKTVLQTQA